jgi:hypothetical protein
MGVKSSKSMDSKIYPFLSTDDIEFDVISNPIQINAPMQNNDSNISLEKIKTKFLDRLPEFIVIEIYKNYLEAEVYYSIYKDIIESVNSNRLDNEELKPLIPIILSKPIVCKYINNKCIGFKESFKDHKIKNKKSFELMKKGESFSLSILMYLYH